MPKPLPLAFDLQTVQGRTITVAISSDRPPQLVLNTGMVSYRLASEDADKLTEWWAAWQARRQSGGF